jgi:hypothetical protein
MHLYHLINALSVAIPAAGFDFRCANPDQFTTGILGIAATNGTFGKNE